MGITKIKFRHHVGKYGPWYLFIPHLFCQDLQFGVVLVFFFILIILEKMPFYIDLASLGDSLC